MDRTGLLSYWRSVHFLFFNICFLTWLQGTQQILPLRLRDSATPYCFFKASSSCSSRDSGGSVLRQHPRHVGNWLLRLRYRWQMQHNGDAEPIHCHIMVLSATRWWAQNKTWIFEMLHGNAYVWRLPSSSRITNKQDYDSYSNHCYCWCSRLVPDNCMTGVQQAIVNLLQLNSNWCY